MVLSAQLDSITSKGIRRLVQEIHSFVKGILQFEIHRTSRPDLFEQIGGALGAIQHREW